MIPDDPSLRVSFVGPGPRDGVTESSIVTKAGERCESQHDKGIYGSMTLCPTQMQYEFGARCNENQGSGYGSRWKKGAMNVSPHWNIGTLAVFNGEYPIRACVSGKLLECNERLHQEHTLLQTDPYEAGLFPTLMKKS